MFSFSYLGLSLHPSKSIDIANGLEYLHSHDVVHGDLGGVRSHSKTPIAVVLTPRQPHIIVDAIGHPCIMEYGIVNIFSWPTEAVPFRCLRWTEPKELPVQKSDDVYSFAMVVVEVGHRY